MLLELVVENYAVVERLRVQFHAGLNLLTGETGSGKSIVVDALGLLLGGRASAETIRTGAWRPAGPRGGSVSAMARIGRGTGRAGALGTGETTLAGSLVLPAEGDRERGAGSR